MNYRYSVLLFLQKERKSFKSTLNLEADRWAFDFRDDEGNRHTTSWELPLIKRYQNPDGSICFRYEKMPLESFETNDLRLMEQIRTMYPANSFSKIKFKARIEQWQLITIIISIIIAFIAFLYFWVLPHLSHWMVNKIPVKKEIELGKNLKETIVNTAGIDKELTELVQQFADSIHINSAYTFNLTVINDTILNAFALPGGYIVIYTSMLNKLETYDQLAALISHEASHITQRHSLNAMANNLSGMILLQLFIGNTVGMSSFLIENISKFKQLSYSRELEEEADLKGLEILKLNNINQHGMTGLFTILQSSGIEPGVSFLSSHPLSSERKRYALEIANKQSTVTPHPYLEDRFNKIQKLLNE